MSLQSVRWITLVLLFLETQFVGIVPLIILRKWNKRKAKNVFKTRNSNTDNDQENKATLSSNKYIQVMLQFGGGALFATIFGHLIPEVKENFETYYKSSGSIFKNDENDDDSKIPYVEITICVGFFVIFLCEEIMHSCLDRYYGNESFHIHSHLHSRKSASNAFVNYGTNLMTESTLHSSIQMSTITTNGMIVTSDKNENESDNKLKDPILVLFLRGFVIVSAFSVHSLFEGLSIGLQKSPSDIWSMFFAITTHKLVIAFVLSMELYDQSKRLLIVTIHMAFFSIMSPIGILITILSDEGLGEDSESNPIVILLTSLATGTLLYIVFYEILQKDRCDRISELVQFFSIIVGFILMLTILLLLHH